MAAPVVKADARWEGGLRFAVSNGERTLLVDGDGLAGPSPVFALVASLAGCMASDVVHILLKARLPLVALRVVIDAERSATDPRRVRRVALRFEVGGDVPLERVEHAVRLSKETYCSVLHSLATDIELATSVVPV
jgi:putative redox protein